MQTQISYHKNPAVFSVACLGLEWRSEVSLKSLLGLIKDRMSVVWQHSDDVNADVIVYNPSSPLAQAMLRRESGGSRRRVMVPCSTNDPGPAGLGLPLGASRLMQCLERASGLLGVPSDGQRAQQGLCHRLDDLLHAPGIAGIILSVGGTQGLLEPESKTMHWPHALDADVVAQFVASDVSVEPLYSAESAQFHRIVQPGAQSECWDGPLWAVGINTSRGRLLSRLDARRRYRLTRWPDFGIVGRRSADLQCAALLSQKELSPEELASLTGLPEATVSGFVNACALCGYLEEASAPADRASAPATPAKTDSFGASMLRRIRRAFSPGSERV